MNELIEAETGLRQAGIMYLAEVAGRARPARSLAHHARQYQLDTASSA